MTGPVEFLEAAHNRAEETAQATTPVPVAGQWSAVRDKHADDDAPLTLIQGHDEEDFDPEGYSSGRPVIAYAAEWQDEAEANLRHIALNDPHSVLRRVTAERKILAACEEILAIDGWEYDDAPNLANETICNLAEGWGWTEETP